MRLGGPRTNGELFSATRDNPSMELVDSLVKEALN